MDPYTKCEQTVKRIRTDASVLKASLRTYSIFRILTKKTFQIELLQWLVVQKNYFFQCRQPDERVIPLPVCDSLNWNIICNLHGSANGYDKNSPFAIDKHKNYKLNIFVHFTNPKPINQYVMLSVRWLGFFFCRVQHISINKTGSSFTLVVSLSRL